MKREDFFQFNLNDYFYVHLTDEGFIHWRNYYKAYSKRTLKEYQEQADEDGFVAFQAHHFIEIFKDYIPSFTKAPFWLTIRIKKNQLNEVR